MGIIEFLFGKTKTIEDEFFGVLQLFDSKDKTKQHFEGKRSFSPTNQSIWLEIDADFSGPTNEQKQFFRQIEDQYDELVEKVKPLIITEYQNLRADFAIQDFKNEFTPVHLTIPLLPQSEIEWELAFDTIHDSNHTVIIGFSNFESAYLYIKLN